MKYKLLTILLMVLMNTVCAVQPDDKTLTEINHLLVFIKTSSCQFNRNGVWYSSSDAASHLNEKYQYVLKKGLIGSTNDFIDYAATKSSLSGKNYLVQCGKESTITSYEWLKTELTTFRNVK
jgi:hypothetical protein